jgi:hypothetical protein
VLALTSEGALSHTAAPAPAVTNWRRLRNSDLFRM